MTTTAIDKQFCAGCRYWLNRYGESGPCRRHAPVLAPQAEGESGPGFVAHMVLKAAWPLTHPLDWCGDWERVTIKP